MTPRARPPSLESRTKRRNLFRREGDYWTVAFEGRVVRLRDTRGIRYLAELLHRPGTPIPAAALRRNALPDVPAERHAAAEQHPRRDERARLTVTKGIRAAIDHITALHPSLGAHLEATVHRGYSCSYDPSPQRPVRWKK